MVRQPGRVVDDELHVRELPGNGNHVARLIPGAREIEQRQALVAAHDPYAQVVRMLDHGQPDRRIVQIKAPAAGPPRGIDLECGHVAGLDRLRHLLQPGLEPAEVGCENIL